MNEFKLCSKTNNLNKVNGIIIFEHLKAKKKIKINKNSSSPHEFPRKINLNNKQFKLSKKKDIINIKFLDNIIFNYSKFINILLIIVVLILKFTIISSYNSQITITIKGKGTQYIVCCHQEYYFGGELPDHIYINEELQNISKVDKILGLTKEYNNITLEWDSPVTSCHHMFFTLDNITNIDASKFDTSKVTDMTGMFENITLITSLNLYNFITSSVTDMWAMFNGCTSLISLNLNNFDTSSVTRMYRMFEGCVSLISLNLSSFNTLNVTNFTHMFYNCTSIQMLDLGNFESDLSSSEFSDVFTYSNPLLKVCLNQNKANNILSNLPSGVQNDCNEVHLRLNRKKIFEKDIYLYSCGDDFIHKFEYNNICYESCPKETYYNQTQCEDIPIGYYLNDTNLMSIDKCYEKCKTCSNESINLNLCISCNIDLNYFQIENYDNDNNNSFIDCVKDIENEYYLDNYIYKPCYSSCKKCSSYGNETQHNCIECKLNYTFLNDSNSINSNCYEKCKYFYYFDSLNNYKCTNTKECPHNINKLIPEKKKCISNCYLDNYQFEFNNICYNSTYKNESNETEKIEKQSEGFNISDDNSNITNVSISFDELINAFKNDIINGKKIKMIKVIDNMTLSFTPLDEQEDEENNLNVSIVDIGKCEDILKEKYNLTQNDTLFIFKNEYYISSLLYPIVQYEIYSNITEGELNMEYCKDIKIIIKVPVSINEKKSFMHDPLSDYYNNICNSYTTEDKTDIILSQRKKEFNEKNMSLCELDCIYKGYDSKTKKASCECPPIGEISLEKIQDYTNFVKKFKNIKNVANVEIIKCYYLLFNKEELKYNIGSYTLLSIIFIQVILMLVFIFKGYNIFINYILKKFINEKKNKRIIKTNISNTKKKMKRKKAKCKTSIKSHSKIHVYETKSNPHKKIKKKKSIIKIKNNNSNINKLSKNKIFNSSQRQNIINNSILNNNNNKIKDFRNTKNIIKYNDYQLNTLIYEEALKLDKRNYYKYYISLLKYNHLLIFTFYTNNDYNSKIIKICLFLFIFALQYAVNSLLFDNSTIQYIYINKGIYNFIFQLPKIIYSSIICGIFKIIITYFSLSEKKIIEFKSNKKNKNTVEFTKFLFHNFIIFYILNYFFLIIFWYYLAIFCSVFKNSQIKLIKDTLASFTLLQIYPFVIALLPGIFRLYSLKAKNGDKKFIYNISKFLQLL